MLDFLKEIWSTLSHNKLRTSLTGFAVAWGIFMLIALLGAGNGLMNAFISNAFQVEVNAMEIYPGSMSKPYKGLKEGTLIRLDYRDVELLKSPDFANVIDEISPVIYSAVTINYEYEALDANLVGATAPLMKINKIGLQYGRFISPSDEKNRSKVIVLENRIASRLLGEGADPQKLIGQFVKLKGLAFKVVGISYTDESNNNNYCYAPFSVVESLRGNTGKINSIAFTFHGLESQAQNEAFEERVTRAIATAHHADPSDSRVVYIWNHYTTNIQTKNASSYITIALWILGIFTLMSGIVGVSNIMLISVKERTHEFGIRKAIGAKPWDILKLITAESIGITAFFGYIGMVLGLLACEVMNNTLAKSPTDLGFAQIYLFKDPTVGIDVAIKATLLLILAGTISGLIPAWKASRVKPIEALRNE